MTGIAKAGADMYSSQVPAYPFNGKNVITVFDKIGFYHLHAIGGSNVNGYDVSPDPKIKGRYIDADNDSTTFSSTSMEYVPNGEIEAAFLYVIPNNIQISTSSQPGTYIQGPKGGKLFFDKAINGVYDITDFVKQEGAGHYWGKNLILQNPLSIPWGGDALANWDIVFVDKNENLPPMMTKLNYYFGSRTNNPSTLSDQPFLTKQTGSLKGSMVAGVYGGNRNIDNDQYKIIAYKNNQIVNDSFMSDSARAENNFWNGSITKNGQNISSRNPDRTPANTDIFNYDFTGSPYFPAGIDRLDQVFTAEPVNSAGSVDGYSPHFWGVALEVIPPELVINKSVKNKENKTYYEVGDTVEYSIVAKNKVDGTVAKSVTIEDEVPEGLQFVEGTLKASHNAVPEYKNGKISVNFGHVSDTDERMVTFEAKILDNQAGKTIKNIANVKSDGLDPVNAESDFTVINNPLLESKKSVEIAEKAQGNSDLQHPEAGDTLFYTIETRNTAANSLVRNLTVSDAVPAELDYVPGSLTVDGVPVTDAEGDDKGHYMSGQVFAKFGDVLDMNWHTVQFKTIVQPGQAGKNIINIASVGGDNTGTPDRPREVVEIYPRNPQIETEKFAANTNVTKATYEVGDIISYTIRARGVVNDTYLENLTITDTLPAGLEYVAGSLKVDGVSVTDAQGDDAGYSVTGQVYGSFGNVKDMNWHTLEFQVVIQSGQGGRTIQNTALVTGDNIGQPGTPTEKVVVEPEPPVDPPVDPPIDPPIDPPVDPVDPPVTPPVDPVDPVDPPVTPPVDPVDPGNGGGGVVPRSPVVESGKFSKDLNGGSIEVGDTIEYTIRARNTVSGSQVTNMVISDELPKELEYVTGTLKVDGVSVTDNVDSDRGEYANGTVKGKLGTVTDTAWHTLAFQAKIIKGEHGDIIKNIGVVGGDNLNVPSRPSEEITVSEPVPAIESQKEAKDLNGGTIHVGDVIEYTIRTRNTTQNGVVNNPEISDKLPKELEYVAGSLKVDGQSVTDAQDGDKGSYVEGKIRGQFGNIADTAWHTIVFRAKVTAGQAGQTISNIGEVTGDNLLEPDHPYEDIIIDGGSGSTPGVPGETSNGSSPGNSNNPGLPGGTGSSSENSKDSAGKGTGSLNPDPASERSGPSGTPSNSVKVDPEENEGADNKLPNTSTNMYNFLLAGCILMIAGLFLLRRKKA